MVEVASRLRRAAVRPVAGGYGNEARDSGKWTRACVATGAPSRRPYSRSSDFAPRFRQSATSGALPRCARAATHLMCARVPRRRSRREGGNPPLAVEYTITGVRSGESPSRRLHPHCDCRRARPPAAPLGPGGREPLLATAPALRVARALPLLPDRSPRLCVIVAVVCARRLTPPSCLRRPQLAGRPGRRYPLEELSTVAAVGRPRAPAPRAPGAWPCCDERRRSLLRGLCARCAAKFAVWSLAQSRRRPVAPAGRGTRARAAPSRLALPGKRAFARVIAAGGYVCVCGAMNGGAHKPRLQSGYLSRGAAAVRRRR
jgi:hypothetical protein